MKNGSKQNNGLKLPITKITTWDDKKIVIDTTLVEFGANKSIRQFINVFSKGNLIFENILTFSLDNLEEHLCIRALNVKSARGNIKELTFIFTRLRSGGYSFDASIGSNLLETDLVISADLYAKARNIFLDICNPRFNHNNR
jgi:hypothetical protein